MFQVVLTETAAKLVTNLHPDIKRLIRDALREIAENPTKGKGLEGELSGFFSHRTTRYRVIYKINRKQVVVYYAGHRSDVYEAFSRLLRQRLGSSPMEETAGR